VSGLCVLFAQPLTAALNLDFNFDVSVGAEAQAAAVRAANTWESVLGDNVTVTVDFAFDSLGATTLGSTSSVSLQADYDLIRAQMVADEAAEIGANATLNSLPTSATASFTFRDNYNGNPITYGLSGALSGTKANLKALGFTGLDAAFGAADGGFTFSDGFAFDFDNSDGVTSGYYDFETVVLHEIGHLLGFTSVVDSLDFYLSEGSTSITGITPTTLDLFRFDSANVPETDAEFAAFARDLSTEDSAALSDASIAYTMETGAATGSGQQASHFKDNQGIGVLDPTLAPGEIGSLTAADLLAMDLIGWDVDEAALVIPEPATYALLLGSMACLCVLRRVASRIISVV
jgi:hypothetical protein